MISKEYLQDSGKLSSHLQPLLVQFSKMSQSVEKMTSAYQQATSRIGLLETKCADLEMKNQTLQKELFELMTSVKSSVVGNEEKVVQIERSLNILSVHHSELELQLQASLAITYDGKFLWRIPEMKRRIRDAKLGRITTILHSKRWLQDVHQSLS